MTTDSPCKIASQHCEQCGSTDREDLTTGDQGYTACCNERVTSQADCDNFHGVR